MALIEVKLPAMGEGIIEATLISWIKNEGDAVAIDDPIIEVATDKVNSEVNSTTQGVIHKKLFSENDVIPVGAPFVIISNNEEESSSSAVKSNEIKSTQEVKSPEAEPVKTETQPTALKTDVLETSLSNSSSSGDRFYSPLVLNIARQENISQNELDKIIGTGKEGRVTKDDILNYLKNKSNNSNSIPETTDPIQKNEQNQVLVSNEVNANSSLTANQITEPKSETKDYGPNVIVKKMDRMRSLIADHMVKSMQTAPHVSSFVEADVTHIVAWRDRVKDDFAKLYGEKLTYTPIIIEALAKTIREFPDINASLVGNDILIKKDVNIGMAAALPDGNLIVPVIKNADTLNLLGLAKQVNDLGNRAKKNQLKPDEIQGGTYTMTNLGSFGNLFGTPIINQPQVAIMGIGAIVKKPIVITGPEGDTIAIRSMMYLSHSYDHRVVDGFLGGSFVKRLAEHLENFDVNRQI